MAKAARLVLLADTLLALYRQMACIRAAEKRLAQSFQEGLLPGDCHSSLGQEAVAAGVGQHLRDDDLMFCHHRGHGHALSKGLPLTQLFAELYGRVSGCCGGRGGGRNLLSREMGLLGSGGLIGSTITESIGAALALEKDSSERIVVSVFGDGAVLHGRFYEGINLACHWNLPIVFVCENNGYADRSTFEELTAQPRISTRARACGMRSSDVDGNDVTAVYEEAHEAIRLARGGDGPSLIECRTYRIRPHVEGVDEHPPRPAGELEEWMANDPIVRLAQRILDSDLATADELSALEKEVVREILAAHREAAAAPFRHDENVA